MSVLFPISSCQVIRRPPGFILAPTRAPSAAGWWSSEEDYCVKLEKFVIDFVVIFLQEAGNTSQTGLLRPLLGLNWLNWSWTGQAVNPQSGRQLFSVMTRPGAEFVLSDWTPCCPFASIPSSCLAMNHATEGFMGRRRALARCAPPRTAADHQGGWLVDFLLTDLICRYAHKFWSLYAFF